MTKIENYPEYMGVKQGQLIFSESDWPTTIGFKYGTSLVGAGTVARDANHGQGGTGAVRLTTGAVSDNLSQLRRILPYYLGDGKYAFEMKFAMDVPAFGASYLEFGIELHIAAVGMLRAKLRYVISTDEWQYESALNVFTAFSPAVVVAEPTSDTAAAGLGDKFGWVRLVINTGNMEYVSFEAAGKGSIETRDMVGIAIPNVTTTTENILIYFVTGVTAGGGAEDYLTTDWVASILN